MEHSKFFKKIQGIFFEESTITLGTGHTQKTQKVKNYCQAEQINEEKVKLTFLGNEGQPTGIVIEIESEEFLKRYTLDPDYRTKTKEEAEHDRHVAIAEKHRKRGEHYSAEFEYTTALKIDPESVRANFGIGTLYMEMGDVAKAKGVFKKLSEIKAIFEEDNKHLFNEFGIELRKAHMIDEAMANYQKAITISPADDHLYFNVARIYYDKKEWNNALLWLKKALEINPHFRDAKIFNELILKEMEELGIKPEEIKVEAVEGAQTKVAGGEQEEEDAPAPDGLTDLKKELLEAGLDEAPAVAEAEKSAAVPKKQPLNK
ncbi:MAG TPA: tetratricopeptide repeat protein [Desulfomonilia bacterium]|nr:tetratricopeptide repeat protein [Desulfomonilia bacterium]